MRLRYFITLLILFTISCTSVQLATIREDKLSSRKDFNAYLARRYSMYAKNKQDLYDWQGADIFSKKSLHAFNNREVFPEVPDKWALKFTIKQLNLDELEIARERLEVVLTSKYSKDLFPEKTADLQFTYDCWLYEEAGHNKFGEITRCKNMFFSTLAFLEEEIMRKEEEEEQNRIQQEEDYAQLAPEEDLELESNVYNIYFDFDSYKLNPTNTREIMALLSFFQRLSGNYRITLTGHADRVGKKLYNETLARRRVLTVRNAFIRNGIPKDIILIKSYGERNPQIITKDSTREALNRRVSVTVEKLDDVFRPLPLPIPKDIITK